MVDRTLSVERLNPLDWSGWDAAVACLPGGTVFHTAAWARVLHETYGYRPCYFVARSDPDVVGVLPLMEVDSWLTGRRGISLPFADACPPLASDPAASQVLFDAAVDLGRRRRWRHFDLHGRPVHLRVAPSLAYHAHHLDLTLGCDILQANTAPAVRRAIRKAERSPLTLEFSRGPEATEALYGLICRTRHRQGLPPQPRKFFREIQRQLLRPGHGTVALARLDGTPVAAALFLHHGRRALFKFGASDETRLAFRPNNLVMWRAIEWHVERGFTVLDLGRTSLANPGLRQFKLGWGPHEELLRYVRYDCRHDRFLTEPDRAHGWHTHFFRLLPASLSRLIGAAAYKHIA